MNVPPNEWGMTVSQFKHFLEMCRNSDTWKELSDSTDRGKAKGVVNGYQVNEHFVKPFTKNTGCSVALLYNNKKPLQADVMISHAWSEDMVEVQTSIIDMVDRDPEQRGEDLVIWFCIFGNYQAEHTHTLARVLSH